VDLAVLSACQTGLGPVAGGEGVLGLQRAFQVAGARSVLASLWAVDDRWTRTLMEHFYDNLWQRRLPSLEALRQAQLAVLHQTQLAILRGGQCRDLVPLEEQDEAGRMPPEYWAAFVLSGDWR
jgi:CHAT domain-containing protein